MKFTYVDVTGEGCEGSLNLFFGDTFIALVDDAKLATEIRKVHGAKAAEKLDSFNEILVLDLVAKTSDAYSYDRYGEDEWENITRLLVKKGHPRKEILAVLRSKHMRWSADGLGANVQGFIRYYNSDTITKNKPAWMHRLMQRLRIA